RSERTRREIIAQLLSGADGAPERDEDEGIVRPVGWSPAVDSAPLRVYCHSGSLIARARMRPATSRVGEGPARRPHGNRVRASRRETGGANSGILRAEKKMRGAAIRPSGPRLSHREAFLLDTR